MRILKKDARPWILEWTTKTASALETATYGHHIQKPHSNSCRICQSLAVFTKNLFGVATG